MILDTLSKRELNYVQKAGRETTSVVSKLKLVRKKHIRKCSNIN